MPAETVDRRPTPLPALALATLLGLALLGCDVAAPPPRNVLLLTIDTLRADHLSCYGYPRDTSPTLDALAAEGIRFERAVAQWPKTTPSFASMFTATYPKDNGNVRQVGIPVPAERRMLAEVLADRGYSTHAVVANGAVASELGFGQGFHTFRETWKASGTDDAHNNGAVVNHEVEKTLAEIDRSKPFFLWVHYVDPHFPYAPPTERRDLFQGDAHFDASTPVPIRWDRRNLQARAIGRNQVLEGRTDLGFYVARYDAEIAYVDFRIGEMLARLRAEGLLDGTLTVVTADHGESLGEHQLYFAHGRHGFEPTLRVPLIFHAPGFLRPRVEEAPVELTALAPTILELVGVELEEGRWMQGRSWLARLRDPGVAPPRRLAFAEAGESKKRKWQRIVRDDRYKLIVAPAIADQRLIAGEGVVDALYDLEQDPGETRNVAQERPDELARLRRALDAWWSAPQFEVDVDAATPGAVQEMSPETREQLRALGYLQ